jgi:hypothetical protein
MNKIAIILYLLLFFVIKSIVVVFINYFILRYASIYIFINEFCVYIKREKRSMYSAVAAAAAA